MSKNQEYAAQYAEAAKEQMRRYGIPASVILAQGILESSNGQSELSRTCNNHFGIKASASWLKNGGEYALFTDDKPNEKFCKYATVADSYEHHSQILKNSSRYRQCFTLSPDDYKGWTRGIERGGYATGGSYANNLQRIIEANGLQKYDQQVMQEMKAQGREFGVESNPRQSASVSSSPHVETSTSNKGNGMETSEYAFPVSRKDFLFITSPFGMRQDPMNKSKQQMHKGIDIRTNHEAVLATENGGKVVAVNQNTNTAGGKSVTVEYSRADGSKVQTTYMHLDCIAVKQGDAVKAGQQLGISGNTGTRTTGEHLHFGVKTIAADGTKRDIDPAVYLAEIAQKGNIQLQAMHNGTDLLAKYKTETPVSTEQLSPDAWMKKLLSSEDASVGLSGSNDPTGTVIAVEIESQLLARVCLIFTFGNITGLQHLPENHIAPLAATFRVSHGVKVRRVLAQSHQRGSLTQGQVTGVLAEIHTGGILYAHGIMQEVKIVEIHRYYLFLRVIFLQLDGYHPLYRLLQEAFRRTFRRV